MKKMASTSFDIISPVSSNGEKFCSQCNFTAQFESALIMHHQLHHESSNLERFSAFDAPQTHVPLEKSATLPADVSPHTFLNKSKSFRLGGRTSSATRLFNNLKTKICRSRMLFSHNEESESCVDVHARSRIDNRPTSPSECTSKALKVDSVMSHDTTLTACLEDGEGNTFPCHLCNFEADRSVHFLFEADRITVLDRHLLNHHKIGLENLLKLVMAKTKDGLTDDRPPVFGIREPYYKPQDEMIEEGEFIIETVAPKIKILKHSSTNTEDNPSNLSALASDIEKFFKVKQDGGQNGEQDGGNLMSKMAALNQYMCKFVDSSNTLKKVLNQELDMKEGHLSGTEPMFALGLGDQESPRNWDQERARSEKMERNRKYNESSRGDKDKLSSNSFYF